MKLCLRCETEKVADVDHWYFSKGRIDVECKVCRKARSNRLYETNREAILERRAAIQGADREFIRVINRRYRNNNREAANMSSRNYYHRVKDDRHDIIRSNNLRACRVRSSSLGHKLSARVSTRIRNQLKRTGVKKLTSTFDMLPWSAADLACHLERLFETGMSFKNMKMWHIDHIIPLSTFEFSCCEDEAFQRAWALENLAPLWAQDNIEKNARTDWLLPSSYKNPHLRAMYERPATPWQVAA